MAIRVNSVRKCLMVQLLVHDVGFCRVLDQLYSGCHSSCSRVEKSRGAVDKEVYEREKNSTERTLDDFFLYCLCHIRQTCSTSTLLLVVKTFLGMELRYLREKKQWDQGIDSTPTKQEKVLFSSAAAVNTSVDVEDGRRSKKGNAHTHNLANEEDTSIDNSVRQKEGDQKEWEANTSLERLGLARHPQDVWKAMVQRVWKESKKRKEEEKVPLSSSSLSRSSSFGSHFFLLVSEVFLVNFSFLPYEVESLFRAAPHTLADNRSIPRSSPCDARSFSFKGSKNNLDASFPHMRKDNKEEEETRNRKEGGEGGRKETKQARDVDSKEMTAGWWREGGDTYTLETLHELWITTAEHLSPSSMGVESLFALVLVRGKSGEGENPVCPTAKNPEEEKSMNNPVSIHDKRVEDVRRGLAGPFERLGIFYELLSQYQLHRRQREQMLTASALGSPELYSSPRGGRTSPYPSKKDFFFHDTSLLLPISVAQQVINFFFSSFRTLEEHEKNSRMGIQQGNVAAGKKEKMGMTDHKKEDLLSCICRVSVPSVDVFCVVRECNQLRYLARYQNSLEASPSDGFCCEKDDRDHLGSEEKMEGTRKTMEMHTSHACASIPSLASHLVDTPSKTVRQDKQSAKQKRSVSPPKRGEESLKSVVSLIICPARTPLIPVKMVHHHTESTDAVPTVIKDFCSSAASVSSLSCGHKRKELLRGNSGKEEHEEMHCEAMKEPSLSGKPWDVVGPASFRKAESENRTEKKKVEEEEDAAVALMKRRMKNERVDLIQRASNAYYYHQLLHRHDHSLSQSTSPYQHSRSHNPGWSTSTTASSHGHRVGDAMENPHGSASCSLEEGGGRSAVRPLYEQLFNIKQFEMYAGLPPRSSGDGMHKDAHSSATSSFSFSDGRGTPVTMQSMWRDISIGVDMLVMLFSGAAIGYFLGALRGASEGEKLLYTITGVTIMLFVDGLFLMIRMHHEDHQKEKAHRRRRTLWKRRAKNPFSTSYRKPRSQS